VRRWKNILFALAALVWLPASAHCQLEALTGLEFLQCAETTQTVCHPGHDCNRQGCCKVEQSHYRSEEFHVALPGPLLVTLAAPLTVPDASLAPQEIRRGILTAAPPQLVTSRHFLVRTALPVRAPSFAS
jgi:hypothetical protein